ncbi:MAG: hypothetical protein AVDCRST_MAG39-2515 [uncultured Sphingomonadaceae bacterium]|uniref:Uncharacterized protein n=1 Tax=uncultured Sphingomonadaceae bacterium TaxID=169976 RepID=A0A6J4T8S5_9SPHN|nr:MAG: hypothetical protein AVDCRST_MAG39-2515 [uncultured Sphingomonadaceae bacterium]
MRSGQHQLRSRRSLVLDQRHGPELRRHAQRSRYQMRHE